MKNHPHILRQQTIFSGLFFIFMTYCQAQTSFTVPSNNIETISQALAKAKSGDTIWVKPGIYKDQIKVGSGVTLISETLFKAIINGAGGERVVTLGNKSAISGFYIKNGRIGIYSEGADNSITKCLIHDNHQSGILCVGHLPQISDNIIAANGGSGIQGWDVRSTISTINHNTIVNNGNHGLSIGGNSEVIIENNILAFNEKLSYKIDPTAKAKFIRNNIYLNAEIITALPADNFSFDPMFISPTTMNFMLAKESKCRNMSSDNTNIGARLVY
jgi:hypothetical protein